MLFSDVFTVLTLVRYVLFNVVKVFLNAMYVLGKTYAEVRQCFFFLPSERKVDVS